MSDLAERIRKSRERRVTVGGWDFTIRRPTALELSQWKGLTTADQLRRCVTGWNIPEHELVPGGGGKVPPFDAEAFLEWAGDRPEVLTTLAEAVAAHIDEHFNAAEDQEKNS